MVDDAYLEGLFLEMLQEVIKRINAANRTRRSRTSHDPPLRTLIGVLCLMRRSGERCQEVAGSNTDLDQKNRA